MIVGELAITDGTTYIDLKSGAFRLVEWTPATPQDKGGGIWNDSMLEDNRRPVMFKRGNAVETFSLRVVTSDQDSTIRETQELRRLLEKAKTYWTTNWQNGPVWLQARGSCETNTRYAYIANYTAERDDDPYQSPFYGGILATMDEWTLQIERFDWMNSVPGQGACVAIASRQEFDLSYDEGQFVPTQSGDDIQVNMDTMAVSIAATELSLGMVAGSVASSANGIRFRNVTVPPGAIITYARIDVVSSNNDADGVVKWELRGDTDTTPAIFSTYADFMGRVLTTVAFPGATASSWTAGTTYRLMWDDASSRALIQEIIDGAGWAAGNDLAVLIFDRSSTDWRRYAAWDNVTYTEPTLYLEWDENTTINSGQAATCNNQVYFANKHNDAQVTDVWYYDASVPAYVGNQIGAATPYNLFPAVPAAGDILYIGCDTAQGNSGPFSSVVFDIIEGQSIVDVDYEYWNGAAWTALNVNVNTLYEPITGHFGQTGVYSLSFEQESDWAANDPSGGAGMPTGYYIRAEIIAVAAGPVGPTQDNRDVYTVVRPSIDVDELQVLGDVPALARARIYDWSGTYHSQSVLMAVRSQNRGSNFRMYLNFADEQNPVGVSVAAGTNTLITAYMEAPTGWAMRYNPGAGSVGDCSITLDTSIATDWVGKYRCYLRMDKESAVTDCTIQLKVGVNETTGLYTSYYYESDTLTVASSSEGYLMDFGIIDIPSLGIVKEGETFMPVIFTLNLANTTANPNVYIYDLILLPIDEWAGEFTITDADNNTAETIGITSAPNYNYLDIDSLNVKRRLSSFIRYSESDGIQYTWKDITPSAFQLQSNKDQQVFAMLRLWNATDDIWYAPISGLGTIQLNAAARYLSMRGDR